MTIADETDKLLERLNALPDEEARRAWLRLPENSAQLPQLVERLAARVDFYNRSQPQQSLEPAELALLVAQESGVSGLQGMAQRAKAHALRAVGRYQEALPYYTAAINLFKQAKLPAEEGRTYLGELLALAALGHNAECLRRGALIRRRLHRLNDTLNLAKLDANLAIVNSYLGRFEAAIRRYNHSIRAFEDLGLSDMTYPARVSRANALVQVNRFRQATEDYQSSRAFFSEKGMTPYVAMIDANMGFLLFRQGRYDDALTMQLAAREGFLATGQPDRQAVSEVDLGYCYSALGMYNEALSFYQEATRTLSELNMRSELLWGEVGRVQALLNKGELEQAAEQLQDLVEKHGPVAETEQNQHALAVIWLYRAQVLGRLAEGNAPAPESLELCRRAKATFQKLKLPDWYAQSLLLEAELLRQGQEWAEAEAVYQAAREALSRLKLPHLWYQWYYGMGRLKQQQAGISGKPEQETLLEVARQEYMQAVEQVETIRARLRPEEWRWAFMESGLGAYEALVTLCLQDASNPQRVEEAFSYVERSKSRSLLDLLSQNLTQPEPGQNEEQAHLARRIEDLRRELNWFYSQMHNQQGLRPGEGSQRAVALEVEEVSQQLETRERELVNLLRRYRPGLSPEVSAGQSGQIIQELRAYLTEDQQIIEYYVLDNQILAFLIDKAGLRVYTRLCSLEQVTDLQELLNFQINKFNLGQSYTDRHMETLRRSFDLYLQQLYRLLIAPLASRLTTRQLVIVPHGNLHTLPFHALHDGEQYLIERFKLSYAPSAAVLLHCLKQPERPAQKLLALAVPDEQLEGAEAEVRGLQEFFPQARLLVGSEATMEALQANLGWCDILHLASHGIFREDNPLFSLLKLADGWLSVQDVMNWRFQPTLVTLSACQTGLARPLQGDELLGLARGFLSAGAYALVVSLWSVSDEVTAYLMHLFYSNLAQGESRAAALRQAILKLRCDKRYAHPHYWAAFVLVGHP